MVRRIMSSPRSTLRSRRSNEAGVALAAAITAIAALSVLITGVWIVVDLNARTSINRRSALTALLVAEAGASHALSLTRGKLGNVTAGQLLIGADNNAGTTADNGLLINYAGLTTEEQIPAAGKTFGGGTYFVTLEDDPADGDANPLTDLNNRVLARCRAVTPDGASAEILAVIGAVPFPAIATEGKLRMNGNPKVLGPCGGVHANEIVDVSGNPTVQGTVSASDTVTVSGSIKRPDGSANVPLHHQPPVDIPELSMSEMCTDPDFVLRANGTLEDRRNAPLIVNTYDATSDQVFGWKRSSGPPEVYWDLSGNDAVAGTVCIEGNTKISGNPGSSGSPLPMSIFATGSVEFSGNPTIVASDPTGALVVAEGDVSFSGNASSGVNNYKGFIYAGAQCKISGNPRLGGQLLCKDHPNPPGAKNVVEVSDLNASVSGNPEIIFDCSGTFLSKRKILSWVQRLGS